MAVKKNKKILETLNFYTILKRVKKVNVILLDAGYSISQIEKFWEDCKLEARHGTNTKIEF